MTDLRTLAEAARQASDFVHPDHWDTLFVFQNAANPTVVLALLDVVDAAGHAATEGERYMAGMAAWDVDSIHALRAALARYEEVSR